jgi:hypothetical protein
MGDVSLSAAAWALAGALLVLYLLRRRIRKDKLRRKFRMGLPSSLINNDQTDIL